MSYLWWKLLHLAGVLLFVLAHGLSVGVAFRLRKERDRERITMLLDLSAASILPMYLGILLLVAAGVVLGFTPGIPGTLWGAGWLWAAIGVLVATIAAMAALAMPYYRNLRKVATVRRAGGYMHSDEELAHILASSRPYVLAAIGFAGLAALLWLMVLKPF